MWAFQTYIVFSSYGSLPFNGFTSTTIGKTTWLAQHINLCRNKSGCFCQSRESFNKVYRHNGKPTNPNAWIVHTHENICTLSTYFSANHNPPPVLFPFFITQFWIELKINFPNFIFRVIVKIHRKLGYKNDHSSKNKDRKNLKFDFSFIQHIPHLPCKFEEKYFDFDACAIISMQAILECRWYEPVPTRVHQS